MHSATFDFVALKATHFTLVPGSFHTIQNGTMPMYTFRSGTMYYSQCKLVPHTIHVYASTKYQRLHVGTM